MNLKMILFTAAAVTLAMVDSSTAAPRTWSKATGNYDDSMSHRPTAGVRRTFRSVAPRVIREVPAPEAVATSPSTTRRYSYDPSTVNEHCGSSHAAAKHNDATTASEALNSARSTRRYSYEPSMRTYSSKRMRSSGPSHQSLPKSDPRKYNF